MPIPKYDAIYKWKKSGLICDDYNALYETYINTTECQHCQKEFTEKNRRCLDHDHETGLFRKIVCIRCNVNDSYIKYPNGFTEQDRKEYHQEYYQTNKEQKKEYRQKNKEKIRQYQKEYIQEYQRANKEQIKEQKKEYYQANKAEISAYKNQKIKCECGSIVCRSYIAKHKRSKKHSELQT